MSRNAEITTDWADGEHRFRLGWGELELLQEECDMGPYVIADRLRTRARAVRLMDTPVYGLDGAEIIVGIDGEAAPPAMMPPLCGVKEIAAVIRLGLIGGGMKHGEASKLVAAYVKAKPPEENRPVAYVILQAALFGAPEERLGEPPAPDPESGEENSQIFPEEN